MVGSPTKAVKSGIDLRFSWPSSTSDLRIGILVATLSDACLYKVNRLAGLVVKASA